LSYTISLAQLQTDRNANYKAFSFLLDRLKMPPCIAPVQPSAPIQTVQDSVVEPPKLEKPKLPQIRTESIPEPTPVVKEQLNVVETKEDFLPGKSIVTKKTKSDENFYETTLALRRQVKELKDEKEALQSELEILQDTYQNLLELKKENNATMDERRVLLLKSQNLQLERHVVLLTNYISLHKESVAGIKGEVAALEGEILANNRNNTATIKADKALKWINSFQQKLTKLQSTSG
jgi:predicted RNase H-like nuclease (RuvC/YqgF family)